MFHADIPSASSVALFAAIDVLIALAIQRAGCPHCEGPLHASHYQRKMRGIDGPMEEDLSLRLSWCCGREGCRRRVTPPSVRFWGRLVYAGASVMAAISVAADSAASLRDRIGCSRQTLARWRARFAAVWSTPTGRAVSGSIGLDEHQRQQPQLVLSRWGDCWPYVAVMWQLLIHPLTGGTRWETDGQRFGSLDPQRMHFARHLRTLQDPAATR